jgi:hypothetical protein
VGWTPVATVALAERRGLGDLVSAVPNSDPVGAARRTGAVEIARLPGKIEAMACGIPEIRRDV